jgi:oligosaccharide repeat unit polymerase
VKTNFQFPDGRLRTAGPGRPPRLNAFVTVFLAAFAVALAIPLGLWSGLSDPEMLKPFMGDWSAPWAQATAAGLAAALIALPVAWVMVSGVLDLFAFFLVQNALLIAGYFFLGITAWKLDGVGPGILRAGPLVVLINAAGFATLFVVMGMTYFFGALRQVRLQPLHAPPEEYDFRAKWFLRAAGLAITCILALPMARTGIIPLFAENAALARAANMESDLQRALYNLGAGLMPFVTAGLAVLIARKPLRLAGMDGMLAASTVLIQLLSGNRFPLAIAAFVALTLLSMERRFPRLLLLAAFAACMVFFTGLSGFTGLLRQDRDQLTEGNAVLNSVQAAFTGDNLIDVRDAAWVLSQWDFDPLLGRTYLGGLASMLPSGVFPQKKEWHLGLTGVRIVGWDDSKHFGLRITFFGEAFLNFGLAGILALGTVLGLLFGTLLRAVHQAAKKRPACLHYNLKLVVLMQMCMPLANTSDAFTFWGMCGFLALQWLAVDLTLYPMFRFSQLPSHAASRT